jgi:hypothetical protein
MVKDSSAENPLYLKIHNFELYQHYKDRNPPWVKLHRDIWQNPDFFRLKTPQKLYVLGLFSIASETKNNILCNKKWIQSRLGIKQDIDIQALIESGFLEYASVPIASRRKQSANVEKEKEVYKEEVDIVDNPKAIELAIQLKTKILERDPKCHSANNGSKNRWAIDIDKLMRINKRSYEEISQVIDWCQRDDFWCSNILSGKKLRDKFDTLFAQMNRNRPKTPEELNLLPMDDYE